MTTPDHNKHYLADWQIQADNTGSKAICMVSISDKHILSIHYISDLTPAQTAQVLMDAAASLLNRPDIISADPEAKKKPGFNPNVN